jgi:predicted HTH transcriptional regulator
MADYIKRLIAGGENQTLDFKFEVSDYRKIARTLVAFSNTNGGRLLLGVKDNGAIAGVRSEEEYFMIEGAAGIYCRPEVKFEARNWLVEGKKVMEVIIPPGNDKPYLSQDEEGRWIAYIRQADQNFKAVKLLLQVWERQKSGKMTTIRFRQAEKALLSYLEEHESITQSKFRRIAGLSANQSEKILVDFILLGLISLEHAQTNVLYRLTAGYRTIIESSDSILYI